MPHHADFLTQKSTKRWWRSHDAEVDLTCAMAIFLRALVAPALVRCSSNRLVLSELGLPRLRTRTVSAWLREKFCKPEKTAP